MSVCSVFLHIWGYALTVGMKLSLTKGMWKKIWSTVPHRPLHIGDSMLREQHLSFCLTYPISSTHFFFIYPPSPSYPWHVSPPLSIPVFIFPPSIATLYSQKPETSERWKPWPVACTVHDSVAFSWLLWLSCNASARETLWNVYTSRCQGPYTERTTIMQSDSKRVL